MLVRVQAHTGTKRERGTSTVARAAHPRTPVLDLVAQERCHVRHVLPGAFAPGFVGNLPDVAAEQGVDVVLLLDKIARQVADRLQTLGTDVQRVPDPVLVGA
jgi:hypothetical protein